MKQYRVGIEFLISAEDDNRAIEQYIELLHDNGDMPNVLEVI